MIKKSLQEAKDRALQASKEYPDIKIVVMDKRGCRAVCTASDWVYRERVIEGYHKVVTYKGGVEV